MGLCFYNIAFVFSFDKIYFENSKMKAVVKVISLKEETEYKNRYIVKVKKIISINGEKNNEKCVNTKLILYTKKTESFKPGEIIVVEGEFEKASKSRNYRGFDYRNYLKQNKIYGIINSEKIEIKRISKDLHFIFGKIKYNLYKQLGILYEKENLEFLKGILLGEDSNLDEEIKENFRDSSISHILAISGIHITYIIIGLKYVLDKIINKHNFKNAIIICSLLLFIIIQGGTPSCLRAGIMSSIYLISENLYRKNNFYISLYVSFIIIILINPFNIFNLGMWFSYLGTLGIVLFYNFLLKCIGKKKYNKMNKFTKLIFQNAIISISAQILIFPILIYNFNTLSLTFFISNIFISIIIGPIIGIGYLSLIFSYVFIPFSKILAKLENILIFIIFKISEVSSKIPFSKIYIITPNIIYIIVFYISLIYFIRKILKNKFFYFRIMLSNKNLKKYILNKFKSKNIKIMILVMILINFVNIEKSLRIYFIDVGQGDSTLIVTPQGKNILIDGGEGNSEKYDNGKNVLLPYLLDRGIKRIDYVFVSHMDSDHVGGLIYIIENLKVGKICMGYQYETTKQFEELVRVSKEKSIEIVTLYSGNKIKIENDIEVDIFFPNLENYLKENVINNNSLVFKLYYKDFSILFTGDIEKIAEEKILQMYDKNYLKSTILKVAHHGSKTSSSIEFLEKVSPKIALIGVGKKNKFGHPSKTIIELLNKMKIKTYRTDLNGEIEIKVKDNGEFKIKTKYK